MNIRSVAARAAIAVAVGSSLVAGGAAPVSAGEKTTLTIEGVDLHNSEGGITGFAFNGAPTALTAGKHIIEFTNSSAHIPHMWVTARLLPEYASLTGDEIRARLDAGDFSIFDQRSEAGAFAAPGDSARDKTKLAAGTYAFGCFIGEGDRAHYNNGMFGTYTVA